jgi:MutS domain V
MHSNYGFLKFLKYSKALEKIQESPQHLLQTSILCVWSSLNDLIQIKNRKIVDNLKRLPFQMREMEYICRNVTTTSLVVIDELCRSTNVKEGEILAWCFCEKLCKYIGVCNMAKSSHGDITRETESTNNGKESLKLKSISRPFIFVTTHFLGLTKLAYQYPNVTK